MKRRKSMIDIAERKRKISLINKRMHMKKVRIYTSAQELKVRQAKTWIRHLYVSKVLISGIYKRFDKLRCQREEFEQNYTQDEGTDDNLQLQEHSINDADIDQSDGSVVELIDQL